MGEFYYLIAGRGQGTTSFLTQFKSNPETKTQTAYLEFTGNGFLDDANRLMLRGFSNDLIQACQRIVREPYLIGSTLEKVTLKQLLPPIKYKHGGNILIDSVYGRRDDLKWALCLIIDYLQEISSDSYNVVWFENFSRLDNFQGIEKVKDLAYYKEKFVYDFIHPIQFANGDNIRTMNRLVERGIDGQINLEHFERLIAEDSSLSKGIYAKAPTFKALLYSEIKFVKGCYAFHRPLSSQGKKAHYYDLKHVPYWNMHQDRGLNNDIRRIITESL